MPEKDTRSIRELKITSVKPSAACGTTATHPYQASRADFAPTLPQAAQAAESTAGGSSLAGPYDMFTSDATASQDDTRSPARLEV